MKYILDTHTAIWALEDKTKLSQNVKSIIDDISIPLCISIISAWEIAIKVSAGKLDFTGGSKTFLEKIRHNDIEVLDIKGAYIEQLETLPFIHRDPLDRLIISTALSENLTVLTIDDNIHKYDVPWIW